MAQKIAFIDDEKAVLESLKWVFREEPYELFTFQSPLNALEKLEKGGFAVVVADQVMPEMEGAYLLHQIKRKWPKTECMLMTAFPDMIEAQKTDNRIIEKPWDISELKRLIRTAVEHYEEEFRESVSHHSAKKTILYVENDEFIIEVIDKILRRLGYEVVITSLCSEAIRLLQSRPAMFDLVITDRKMPDMDGLELSKMLLKIRPDIPVILCTGFSDLVMDADMKAAGIRAIVAKPFSIEDMAKVVRKVLEEM